MAAPSIATSAYGTATSSPCTVAITQASGSNRLVLALVNHGGYNQAVSSAVYGGVSMTAVWADDTYEDGNQSEVRAFYVKEANLPADGSRDCVISGLTNAHVTVLQLDGVDQTTPVNVYNGAVSITSTAMTVSATTTVADCLLFGLISLYDARTLTWDSPAVSINISGNVGTGLGQAASAYQAAASAASHAVAATLNGSSAKDAQAVLAIAPVAGGAKTLTLGAVAGVGAITLVFNHRAALSVAPAGVGAATVALAAKRVATAVAAGVGASTATLAKVVISSTAEADGVATATAGLVAKRAVTAQAQGTSTASAYAMHSAHAAAAGAATTTVALGAVRPITAQADGAAVATAAGTRWVHATASALGEGQTEAALVAIRYGTVLTSGQAITDATLTRLPRIQTLTLADVMGVGTATATLRETAAAAAYTGKYAPEHATALADLAASTGFGSEHASALADLAEAGI